MAMMPDSQAREVLKRAWASVHPDAKPTDRELQAIQAICRFEGRYGDWIARNNWGAYQCTKHRPPCEAGHCVEHTDHHKDGSAYQWCYRTYDTPEEGAAVVVSALTKVRPKVWTAILEGNARAIAWQMGQPPIYHETAPEKYAAAIMGNAKTIAASLGEPLVLEMGKLPAGGEPPKVQPKPPSVSPGDVIGPFFALASLATISLTLAHRRR